MAAVRKRMLRCLLLGYFFKTLLLATAWLAAPEWCEKACAQAGQVVSRLLHSDAAGREVTQTPQSTRPLRDPSDSEHLLCRPQRSIEPERSSEFPRARPRAGVSQPLAVDIHRSARVDEHVAVTVLRMGRRHNDLLMPAVHARNGIGMNGENKVLVDSRIAPPDAARVGIGALEGADALHLP